MWHSLAMALVIAALPSPSGVPFNPNSDQVAYLESPYLQSFFMSGFGGGKTTTICARLLLDALQHVGTYGLGAPTHGMLKRTTWKSMRAVTPPQLLARRPTEPPDARMELVNGSVIEGYHLSEPDTLDGPNLSGFAIDEICNRRISEEAIDRVINRLRGGGDRWASRLYGAGNPRGHNWFWARYVASREELIAEGFTAEQIKRVMSQRRFASVYTTTTYANAQHLGRWYIEQMEATYPEGARRDRAMRASFDEASGDVYADFDLKEQLIAAPADWVNGLPPAYMLLVRGIDFGGSHAFACEAVAIDARGGRGKEIYYVFAEHHQAGEPDVYKHAAKIRAVTTDRMKGRRWDTYSEHEPHTRSTLGKSECLGTVPVLAWKGTEDLRIAEINRLCREGRFFIVGDEIGRSGLLRPRCPGLVNNLTQREYEKDGSKKGLPEDANNDATDALEYAIGSYVHYGVRSTRISQW